MADEYIRAKSAVSVPYANRRHVAHKAGDSIRVADLSDNMRSRLNEGDPWLANLFESGSAPEEEHVDRMGVDAAKLAMEGVEALTKERATMPREDRHGADSRVSTAEFDKGRTLPTSGADIPADEKFAEGSADTSEDVPAEHARQYSGARAKASEAPSAVDAGEKPTEKARKAKKE